MVTIAVAGAETVELLTTKSSIFCTLAAIKAVEKCFLAVTIARIHALLSSAARHAFSVAMSSLSTVIVTVVAETSVSATPNNAPINACIENAMMSLGRFAAFRHVKIHA